MSDSSMPGTIARFHEELKAWLDGLGYRIPLEWDGTLGQLFMGNRKRKTRTRFTREEIEAEAGVEKAMGEARRIVEDWKRLWSTKAAYDTLPRTNQQDLAAYFGASR